MRAQRYGLQGTLADFGQRKLVPCTDLIHELIGLLRDQARDLGCRRSLERGARSSATAPAPTTSSASTMPRSRRGRASTRRRSRSSTGSSRLARGRLIELPGPGPSPGRRCRGRQTSARLLQRLERRGRRAHVRAVGAGHVPRRSGRVERRNECACRATTEACAIVAAEPGPAGRTPPAAAPQDRAARADVASSAIRSTALSTTTAFPLIEPTAATLSTAARRTPCTCGDGCTARPMVCRSTGWTAPICGICVPVPKGARLEYKFDVAWRDRSLDQRSLEPGGRHRSVRRQLGMPSLRLVTCWSRRDPSAPAGKIDTLSMQSAAFGEALGSHLSPRLRRGSTLQPADRP